MPRPDFGVSAIYQMTVSRCDGEWLGKVALQALHSAQTTMTKIKLMQTSIFLENVHAVINRLIGSRKNSYFQFQVI
jgi:hypothetical protein